MEDFFIIDDCLIIRRKNTRNKNSEALLQFRSEAPHSFQKILEYIQFWNCSFIYVYTNSNFHVKSTYTINILYRDSFSDKINFEQTLPKFDLTKDPCNVPVTFMDTKDWYNVSNISILPFNGWDFYQLEWILHRWESSFGIFDYDEFLITPSYPKDIYNNLIPPSVFFFTIQSYVEKYSIEELEINFFAIYLLFKDNLGKGILNLFYKYHDRKNSIDKLALYKDLHKLYHATEINHEYRVNLFFQNYSIGCNSQFRIDLFILQYFSFYGMFVCNQFLQQRKNFIISGIQHNLTEYLTYFQNKELLLEKINKMNTCFKKNLTWIGKRHVEKLNEIYENDIWAFLQYNWVYAQRNICLWDIKLSAFEDRQSKIGRNIKKMFSKDWVQNFDKPDYIPRLPKLKPIRKRKL